MKSASLVLRATVAAAVAAAADSIPCMNSASSGKHVLRYTLYKADKVCVSLTRLHGSNYENSNHLAQRTIWSVHRRHWCFGENDAVGITQAFDERTDPCHV